MAVSASSSTRLGCGREIDQVWESIDTAPDAHEQTCPYCQRARASLGQLRELTAGQREADRTDPDLQPGEHVLGRIMDVARAEVRRANRLPLDEPDPDQLVPDLTVSEQTVSATARRSGDAVAGVQVRRCRVELVARPVPVDDRRGQPRLDAEPAESVPAALTRRDATSVPDTVLRSRPARVAVFLQISVSAAASIPVVSNQVRAAVIDAVNSEVGMDVVRVEIEVRDVHDV